MNGSGPMLRKIGDREGITIDSPSNEVQPNVVKERKVYNPATIVSSPRQRYFRVVIPVVGLVLALLGQNVGISSVGYGLLACYAANQTIPAFASLLLSAGRTGADLNKKGRPIIPESLGIAVGAVYLVTLFLFLPIPFTPWLMRREAALLSNSQAIPFPFEKLGDYTAALLSISCMLFLGFADDILNLKWRHKILLPAISCLPLLMIYAVTFGRTVVVVPLPLHFLLGPLFDLGFLYYVYMAMLSIFCTHSINILAGVNGVEVGQSVVIAAAVACHNLRCLLLQNMSSVSEGALEFREIQYFSLSLILPFLGVSLALLRYNWYPARVFVGDTYCYFAGMTFAVVGILGHFSKTLLLFFVPQIFNFVYSAPQLFGLVPCPRHRMPKFDEASGWLRPSTVTLTLNRRNRRIVGLLCQLRLLAVQLPTGWSFSIANGSNDQGDAEITVNSFTLLNLLLVHCGDMREDQLAKVLMGVQALCCLSSFALRHYFARFLFPA